MVKEYELMASGTDDVIEQGYGQLSYCDEDGGS